MLLLPLSTDSLVCPVRTMVSGLMMVSGLTISTRLAKREKTGSSWTRGRLDTTDLRTGAGWALSTVPCSTRMTAGSMWKTACPAALPVLGCHPGSLSFALGRRSDERGMIDMTIDRRAQEAFA